MADNFPALPEGTLLCDIYGNIYVYATHPWLIAKLAILLQIRLNYSRKPIPAIVRIRGANFRKKIIGLPRSVICGYIFWLKGVV
jgi:hypothetical protein